MASFHFEGYKEGKNTKDVLQQFYASAKELIDDEGNLFFQSQESFYPAFYAIVEDAKFLVKVKEHVEDEARILCEEKAEDNLRRQSKRLAYLALARYTGIQWPWGALGGIRPTYIAEELLTQYDSDTVSKILEEDYFLSSEKIDLLMQTSLIEEGILANIRGDAHAIYIGVPFCPTKCWYCSFTTEEAIGKSQSMGALYLDALEKEIKDYLLWPKNTALTHLRAIYVGGGTPADFTEEDFDRLVDLVLLLADPGAIEITFELGRADCISERKLRYLRSKGVRRICINPQSFDDAVLLRLGRNTKSEDILQAYAFAKELDFLINLDFIAGLPMETEEGFLDGISKAIALDADEITIHTLALKRGSKQYQKHYAGDEIYDLRPDPLVENMISKGHKLLMEEQYLPYYLYRHRLGLSGLENVSFAKAGAYCEYNLMMMADRHSVISFGTPAISKRIDGKNALRLASPKSLHMYLDQIDNFLVKKREHFIRD